MTKENAVKTCMTQLFYMHVHTLEDLRSLREWFKRRDYQVPAELTESIAVQARGIEYIKDVFASDDIPEAIRLRLEQKKREEMNTEKRCARVKKVGKGNKDV